MLAVLAEEYCAAINNSAVPTIQSAWSSVLVHELRTLLKEALGLSAREAEANCRDDWGS